MPISAGCSNPAASIFFLHLIAAAAAWLSTVYRFQAAADLQGRLQFSFLLYYTVCCGEKSRSRQQQTQFVSWNVNCNLQHCRNIFSEFFL